MLTLILKTKEEEEQMPPGCEPEPQVSEGFSIQRVNHAKISNTLLHAEESIFISTSGELCSGFRL